VKKILAVLFAFAFPFLASGCVKDIIKAGEERDGAFYGAQVQAQSINVARDIALANVPACKFTAVPGETITFGGLQEFACYGGVASTSAPVEITQRISPFWAWSTANMGILGMLGFTALALPDGAVQPQQVIEQDRVIPVQPQVVNPFVLPTP
jgi:hypothetical protein